MSYFLEQKIEIVTGETEFQFPTYEILVSQI